jgi:simple sugar transport system permease protein
MSRGRRILLGLAAPLLALVFSIAITAGVLLATGNSPLTVLDSMVEFAAKPRVQTLIVNSAVTYYFAAVAVAVGFRMNLFNIGVDGQYRLAAMLAAAVGGAVALPSVLHVGLIILVAVLVGAAWAGIAGLLKVYRGVSEVISTIMLNAIATFLVAYLLQPGVLAQTIPGSNNIQTAPIPPSGQVPGISLIPGSPPTIQVYGLIVAAVIVGVGYWFVLGRTRFGFDLRATGASETAAVASGVSVKRMVLASMLISGAIAGLVGMPQLLGASYTYSLDFPAGLGFTGIAIALLGRNHPVGIAFGALLFGFLDNASTSLELVGVSQNIVKITQGVIVLAVVVAYEVVRRVSVAAAQRDVGRQLGTMPPSGGAGEPTGAVA